MSKTILVAGNKVSVDDKVNYITRIEGNRVRVAQLDTAPSAADLEKWTGFFAPGILLTVQNSKKLKLIGN